MPDYLGHEMPGPFPTDDELLRARSDGRVGVVVERVLNELIGLPWRDLGRAADLIWLGFGDDVHRRPLPPYGGSDLQRRAEIERQRAQPLARHRLHLQCPFRVDTPEGPIVGSQDIYRNARAPHDWMDAGTWQAHGANLFDHRASELGLDPAPGQVVEAVSADAGGGFSIRLTDGWRIVVAPASATITEFWRYFHADGGDHFVLFPSD